MNVSACLRSTSKIRSGELQLSSSLAKGWEYRSCPVSFLYSSHAPRNISAKFEAGSMGTWLLASTGADIGIAVGSEKEGLRQGVL